MLGGPSWVNRGAASGHETDQSTTDSPENLVILAKGINPDSHKSKVLDGVGGAEMTYYDHPGGGGVFAVGSITYTGSLAVDSSVSRITKNVIDRFIAD